MLHGLVSVSTFLSRLRSAGLKAHRPYVGVQLTVCRRRLRLNWARGHYHWSRRRWNRVLFTDESRFNVQFADGRLRVWRRTGKSMDENNIAERDRYSGGSVMIWGECSYVSGKTELVTVNGLLNVRRCCDEIIIPNVIPVLQRGRAHILQLNKRLLSYCSSHNVQPLYSRATFRHSTGLCV